MIIIWHGTGNVDETFTEVGTKDMKRRFLISSIISTGIFGFSDDNQAFARGRFRFRGRSRGGRKIYSADTLKQEQLQQCLLYEQELNANEQKIVASAASIQDMEGELQVMSQQINIQRVSVDRYSQNDVDEFNASIGKYEERRIRLNNAISRHNALIEANNKLVLRSNSICADKYYYEDDMQKARDALNLGPINK